MKTLLRERFGNLNATGKFWMWAGLVTLLCSMAMAYDYASQFSWKHGLVLAAVSFATAFLPEESYKHWRAGMRGVAVGLVVVSIPMFWQEAKSHIAYTAGFRGINVETASLQQTRYDDGRNSVEQANRDIVSAEARIKQLSWLPSDVTATGIASAIDTKNEEVRQEAKRGGCGPNCLRLRQELTELEKRKGAIEDLTAEKAKLAAAKAWLENAKNKAAAIEHKPSIVSHQNTTLFKLASLLTSGNLEASPLLKEVVEQENTVGLALMPVILPALCFFMMGLYRKHEDDDAPATPYVARETVNTKPTIQPLKPVIEYTRLGDAARILGTMKTA